MVRGALVLSTVCLIPSLLKMSFGKPPSKHTHPRASLSNLTADDHQRQQKWRVLKIKHRTKVVFWYIFNIIAILVQIGALVSIGYFGNYHHQGGSLNQLNSSVPNALGFMKGPDPNIIYRESDQEKHTLYQWMFPLVLFLVSLLWWENPIECNRKLFGSSKLTIPFLRWKKALHCYRQKSSIISSMWSIGVIIAFPYIIMDSFELDIYVPNAKRKSLAQIMVGFAPVFCQIGGALLAFCCSLLACKLNMQVFCFTLPLFLSTPLTVLGILLQSQYQFIPIFGQVFLWVSPEDFQQTAWTLQSYWQFAVLGVAWISAMIIGGHVWSARQNPMDRSDK